MGIGEQLDYLPEGFTGQVLLDGNLYYLRNYSAFNVKYGQALYWYYLHREDGPAILRKKNRDLFCDYYLNGKQYAVEGWLEQLTPEQRLIALCNPENFK